MMRYTKVWTIGWVLIGLILMVGLVTLVVPLLVASAVLAAGAFALTARIAGPRPQE